MDQDRFILSFGDNLILWNIEQADELILNELWKKSHYFTWLLFMFDLYDEANNKILALRTLQVLTR